MNEFTKTTPVSIGLLVDEQQLHRALPWEEYLFQSDHFGIFLELPLFAAEKKN